MANETEKKSVTGLDYASDRKEAEYDLVQSLLEAAEFKTSDDSIVNVNIRRNGKFLFTVHIHPISDTDTRFARKKATIYMPNPNGKKLPPIEKDFDNAKFTSWLIYLATTEEDQEKIWGNPEIMKKKGLQYPFESIDVLLNVGEKRSIFKEVYRISGLDDDDEPIGDDDSDSDDDTEYEQLDEVEYAKN
jgi:hypothetical protein